MLHRETIEADTGREVRGTGEPACTRKNENETPGFLSSSYQSSKLDREVRPGADYIGSQPSGALVTGAGTPFNGVGVSNWR